MFVLFICILLVPAFAGCSLVTTNINKQLEEVAISYDNGRVVVTREDLITTYNSIGNSRFDDSSTPTKEGVESTLELALDRAILVDFLTADDMEEKRQELGVSKVVLSTYQLNEVWQYVYDYVNSSVESYEVDLRADDGMSLPIDEEEDADDTSYVPYEKTYEFIGNGQIRKIEKEVEVANKSIQLLNSEQLELRFEEQADIAYFNFRSNYWHYTDSILMNDDAVNEISYSDQAWSKWINQLIRNENGRDLSTEAEEVFLRQIKKVYDLYYENAILTAFQENYENDLNITGKMVADKFSELYKAQKEFYDTDVDAFNNAIPTKAESIYYMKNPDDFFKVNHLLVKFNDEQTKAMDELKEKLKNLEITKSMYDAEILKIKMDTKAYNRETGEYEEISKVLSSLNSAMSAAQSENAKLAVFRDFMHRYSEDDATLNAEACYYIPVDNEKIADAMEKNFADGSRDLYDGGMGVVGDYSSEWVETSYGYHIIIYTGKTQAVNNLGGTNVILANLDGVRINPLYNKTMLDKVIEQVSLDSYSSYETVILNAIKAGKSINKNEKVYNDLY